METKKINNFLRFWWAMPTLQKSITQKINKIFITEIYWQFNIPTIDTIIPVKASTPPATTNKSLVVITAITSDTVEPAIIIGTATVAKVPAKAIKDVLLTTTKTPEPAINAIIAIHCQKDLKKSIKNYY